MALGVGRLGVTTFCAVVLAACSSVTGFSPDVPKNPEVQIISSIQTRSCRFLDAVKGEGTSQKGADAVRVATERAQDQAASKGGNAMFVISVSTATSSSSAEPTLTTVEASAYSCPVRGTK